MSYVGFCPPGVVLPYAGSVAPEGWLLCDGSAISRSVYPALFTAISTTYGTGDGSTTFTLPDFRGVYPRGAGANGTANYGGVTGHTPSGGALGNKGGQKTAKNGLTSSAGSSAVSGSITINSNSVPTDGIMRPSGSVNSGSRTVIDDRWSDGNFYNWGTTTLPNSSHNHSNSIALTANAQSITVGSGDTETTPAFLTVNYIIKI